MNFKFRFLSIIGIGLFCAGILLSLPQSVLAVDCTKLSNATCVSNAKECSVLLNGSEIVATGCGGGQICCLAEAKEKSCADYASPSVQSSCQTAQACGGAGCNVVGVADCKNNNVCCVCSEEPVGTGKECQTTQKGTCAATCNMEKEQNLGSLDCPPMQSCCRLKVTASKPTPSQTSVAASGGAAPGGLVLPPCVKDGSCTLDDIVQTGVNFANFILGLSGALFFLIFLYGGGMYLASFGRSEYVDKGKKAIKGAVFGIIIVVSAWTMVRFIVTTLVPSTAAPTASGQKQTCAQKGAPWSCIAFVGNSTQSALAEAEGKGFTCETGLCPGANNVLCCMPK